MVALTGRDGALRDDGRPSVTSARTTVYAEAPLRFVAAIAALMLASPCALWPSVAFAQEDDDAPAEAPKAPTPAAPSPAATGGVSVSAQRPDALALGIDSGPPPEAPPARPWSKGLVVEGSLGALGYLGAFRRLASTAFMQRVQVGYEIFGWLMVFGGGELALTDTSVGQDTSKTRAFPLWGFDGGARLTVRPTARVGLFAQGSVGLMKADVPANALGVLGFPDTESLAPSFGGRLGVEWYQVDRHMACGLAGGPRLATGFERNYGKGDTPLMIDGALTLRYTF